MLISHVDFQVADFEAAACFYDTVLATLGASRMVDMSPHAVSWGKQGGGPEFWVSAQKDGDGFRQSHIAFDAPSKEAVDAFCEAAVALGAEVLHSPREWPEYLDSHLVGYYAAFVSDPDGNNVEAAYAQFASPEGH